ncbi:hypothetical protein AMATHDRAFT_887 [Amanita thiersii Skay4041]|uniref:Wax synthase domain-containing protein n=1 Tax=Amanita thiersii Skay4041 TaxID=703135 RepID=A0A2A9NXA5_9AGAR|nr:hypothetical protein AMATHDRAFT_887 [Amanita thiersii Skay4041]
MVGSTLVNIVRAVIPHKTDRIPITFKTAPQALICYVPYLYLCYLARRPNTFIFRILALPVVILCIFTASYRFTWTHPSLNVYNWGQCFFALIAVGRSFEMALTRQGMLKNHENHSPSISTNNPSSKEPDGHPYTNGHNHNGHVTHQSNLSKAFGDAFDLAHTLRGLSYKFSRGAYIPPHTRPVASRRSFLVATISSFTMNYLALDILESFIKLLPNGIGTTEGGSIFLPPAFISTPLKRYAVSTFIHLLTGSALMAGFGMVYDLITLIAVGLFNSSPLSWPPMMENPWGADSMHSFWSRRWHQFLRRTLIVLGGIPGSYLAGDIGMFFGTFIASGIFHECSMYAMDRGLDLGGFAFFASQGLFLILERLWRKVTGRRVGGWAGRLWVYLVIFIPGQALSGSCF